MGKIQLFKKRILALALSVSMVLASMDTYVVLAAETESSEVTEDKAHQLDETETTPAVSGEESDSASDADVETGAGSESDSAASDDIDLTSQSDVGEEADTEGDEVQLLADENAEDIIDGGKINDITWTLDKDGLLTITGTGDYISEGVDTPPWCNSDCGVEIKSAVVSVSDIRSTRYMFKYCYYLESVDFTEFNTSNVTDMSRMFFGCYDLTSLDVSNFDTSNVTNMSSMFYGCRGLTSLDVDSFDTSNVTTMSGMFNGCDNLTSLDLSHFVTSNVTNMSAMFLNCDYLTSLDVNSFDTSNVTDMSSMFFCCKSLTSLDLSHFNTSNVTDMSRMFYGCNGLTSLNVDNFDTSNVIAMSEMFYYCWNLTGLNLSNLDMSNVTSASYMFGGNDELSYIITPLNCTQSVRLPTGTWYQDVEATYTTTLPKDLNYSVVLYQAGYPGDDVAKQVVSISGISMSSKVYDGTPNPYTGTVVVKDLAGNTITDVATTYSYTGKLADGSIYSKTTEAPYQTGSYKLSIVISDNDKYIGQKTYSFSIEKRTVTITAPSISIELNEQLPVLSELTCTTDGLIENEKLISEPLLKYSSDDISTVTAGSYDIIPYDADAGNNYSITYVNGTLTVEDSESNTEKQVVSISGISIKSKIYDGKPNEYTGTAVVEDSEGNTLSDVLLSFSYAGILEDESVYAESVEAPSQAGSYTLSVAVTENDKYTGQSSYEFTIEQKELTITAPTVSINVGEQLPVLSELTLTTEGLLENEKLITEPSLKYSAENISTATAGSYDIIPYDADAGNNYSIKYVNGTLTILDPNEDDNPGEDTERDEVLPEDRPENGEIPEGLWIAGVAKDGYAYSGSAIKPEIRVYDHTTLLREKTDYTISYKNNTKVFVMTDAANLTKAPTITVTGKGNYSGKDTAIFNILPINISSNADELVLIEADDITIVANGKAQKPAPTLLWNGKTLKNNTDYTYTYHEGSYEPADTDSGNASTNITDTGTLDSVKAAGSYYIEITGKGNFVGTRRIKLTVLPADDTSIKLISKTTVVKIPNQSYQTQYKDGGVTPEVTVKYGSEALTPGTHYTVTYSNNTKVGTAYAVIKGIEENGYSGTKRVSFKITGIAIKQATIMGLSGQTFIYSGVDFTPDLILTVKVNGQERTLVPETDYKVTWQNNQNAGKATAMITGLGGYTGSVKKTFTIKKFDVAANAGERFKVTLENDSVPYAKGGAKPALKVTFTKEDGEVKPLTEGKDYTLSYKNNTSVNDGSNADKMPTVTIKGKGSFSGTYATKPTYKITTQDIGNLTLSAADKTYQNKKNIYATKVTVTDLDGKTLKAGTDYDKTFTYVYKSVAKPAGGTELKEGDAVDKKDIIPAGTVIEVTVSGKGDNYTGSIKGEYRITQASISGASVSIPKQTYTGQAITLSKDQITVKVKGKELDPDQYEIVPGSYKNNIKKGTASVTIKGVGDYGGIKTAKFTIGAKGFLWW